MHASTRVYNLVGLVRRPEYPDVGVLWSRDCVGWEGDVPKCETFIIPTVPCPDIGLTYFTNTTTC